MSYQDYLNSDYWKKRRVEFKSKTHKRCYICHAKESLQVHHKRYVREGKSILFHERHQDFRLLCSDCHRKIHQYGYMEKLAKNQIKRRELRDILSNLK